MKRSLLIFVSFFSLLVISGNVLAGGGGGCTGGTALTCGVTVNSSTGSCKGCAPTNNNNNIGQCCYVDSDINCDGSADVSFSVENMTGFTYTVPAGTPCGTVFSFTVTTTANLQGVIFNTTAAGGIDGGDPSTNEYGSSVMGGGTFTLTTTGCGGDVLQILIDGYAGATGNFSISVPCPTLCTVPTTITATATPTTICAGQSVSLTGSSSGGTVAGSVWRQWTPGGAVGSTTFSPSPTSTTTYTYKVCNDGVGTQCCTTKTVTVTVVPAFIPNAGADATVCPGGSVVIGGSPTGPAGSTYSWAETGANANIAISGSTTIANPTVTVGAGATGSATYTVTVTNGPCIRTDVVTVTAGPIIANAGADNDVCVGSSITLGGAPTAPAGSTYSWTCVSGCDPDVTLSSSTVANPTLSVSTAQTTAATVTYQVTATLAPCAPVSDQVIITVNPLPVTPVPVASVSPVCAGASSTLSISGGPLAGHTYSWWTAATGGTLLGSANTLVVSPTATTTYYLQALNTTTGCISLRGSVTVTVTLTPVANAGIDQDACFGSSFNLAGSIMNAGACAPAQTWSIVAGTGTFGNANALSTTFTPTSSGIIQLRLTPCTPGACIAVSDDIFLTVNPSPTVIATVQNDTMCVGQITDLDAAASGGTLPPPIITTQSFNSTDPSTVIPNSPSGTTCGAVLSMPISVTGVTSATVGATTTVRVCINVTHAKLGDLSFELCPPGVASGSASCIVLVPSAVLVGADLTSVCFDDIAAAAITTGAAPYTGTWDPAGGVTMASLNGASTNGTWNLNVTDCRRNGGAIGNLDSWSIAFDQSNPDPNPYTYLWSTASGLGSTTASATSYSSSGVTAPATIIKTVTVTDAEGCSSMGSVSIYVSAAPTATISGGGAMCAGDSIPVSIALTGIAPWSFTYTDGTTSTSVSGQNTSPFIFNAVTAGTYTVTSIADKYCNGTFSGSAVVTINSTPPSPVAVPGERCGSGPVPLSVTGCTGIVNWYTAATGGISVSTGASYTPSISATTTYYASCTVNGCESLRTAVTATINPLPIISSISANPFAICEGGSSLLSASASGGTGTLALGWMPGGLTGASVTVSPAATTTYTVTVSDANACTGTNTVTVIVKPVPTSTFTVTTPVCIGANSTITYTGSAPAGATYTWNFAGGTVASGSGQGPYTVNWPSSGTKNITLTVTEAGCVSTVTTVPVVVNPTPTSTFTVTTPVCIGANSTITYTGSAPAGATYSWNFAGGTVASGAGQGPYTVNWPSSGTKNITLTVTQAGCVSTVTTVPVIVNPTPTSTFTATTPVCIGANSTITYTGSAPAGATYTWNFAGGTVASGAGQGPYTVNWPSAGTKNITLTVTEAGCVSTVTTVPVVVNPTPTSTFTVTTPVCIGANSTITYTGSAPAGATYSWNFAGGTVASGAGQGPYTVNWPSSGTKNITLTVTQAGCVSTVTTVPVIVNPTPTSTFTATTPVCIGANSTITYTGSAPAGATYSWNFAGGTVASGAGQGPYTVNWPSSGTKNITLTVTQAGCVSTVTTVPVIVNPTPTSTFTATTPVCIGANSTITYTGSAPAGATYTWNFAGGTVASGAGQGPYTVNWPSAGTKNITLTVTEAGCVSTVTTVPVVVNPTPTSTFTVTTPVCIGANSTITYTGSAPAGATYSWNFAGGTVASGAGQGPYTVNWPSSGTKNITLTVTQAGCVSTVTTVPVIVNPTPTSTFTATTPVCIGANSTITYTGSAPAGATYTWNFAGGTVASGAGQGPYTVNWPSAGTKNITLTVTEAGCVSTVTTVPVIVNPTPTSTFTATTPVCIGANSTITYTGSAPAGATYTWNFAGGTVASGAGQGPYTVNWPSAGTKNITLTVTEAGCVSTVTTVPVIVNPTPTSTFTATTPVCIGANSTITYTGSAPAGATYSWNFAGGTVASGAGQGPYTVNWPSAGTKNITLTVTQAGCVSTVTTVPVIVNPTPTSTFTVTSPVCIGANSTITYTGSAPAGATYTWNFAGGTVASGAGQGPYTVNWPSSGTKNITLTVTQAGCVSTVTTVPVVVNPTPIVTATPTTQTFCSGGTTGIALTSNVAGTTFAWTVTQTAGITGASAGSGTPIAQTLTNSGSTAGTATYTITPTANGCVGTPINVVITVNPVPTAAISGTASICEGTCTNLTITLTGNGPFDVVYTDGTSNFNLTAINTGHTVNVCPSANTSYSLVSVADNSTPTCTGTTTGTANITLNDSPVAVNIQRICDGTNTQFTVSFDITGGSTPYTVTPVTGTGTLTGSTYTSDPIANGGNYEFIVSDANNCSPDTVKGTFLCNCTSFAGTMNLTPITVCEDQAAVATHNGNEVFDADDVLEFVLHSGSGNSLGTEYFSNGTPSFTFAAPLVYGVTYYISAVVGSDDGSGKVDRSDPCMDVSIGTPVIFNPLPTAVISGNATVCNGSCTNLTFTLTGNAPFDVVYTDGTSNFTLNDINTGHTESVCPTGTTTYSLVSVADNSTPTCAGSVSGSALVTVNPLPTAAISGNSTICDGACTDLTFTLTGNGPFDVVYTDGTTPVTLNNIVTGHTVNVCPTANTTYTLVSVTDNSTPTCTGTVSGSAVIDITPLPTAEISGNATICNGACTDLTFTLTGNGPFDVVYTDGTTPVTLNGIVTGHTVSVCPTANTTYSLVSVSDNSSPACVGTVTGSAVITITPLPTATLSGTAAICETTCTDLTFTLTGNGPFDVVYTDGTSNFNLAGIANGYTESVCPAATTTYSLVSVSDNSSPACVGTVSGTAVITINGSPTVSNIIETCNSTNTAYTVTFDIAAGDAGSYTVTGDAGTLTGSTFTSALITSGGAYTFTVDDANSCNPVIVTGDHTCNCATNAGTMDLTPIVVCEDQPAIATHNGNETLDGDDNLSFILHSGSGASLGTIYFTGSSSSFSYAAPLGYGTTYYISAVAGSNDGAGGVDLNDPCLSVSVGTPVIFNPLPTATISGTATICDGSSTGLTFTLTGNAPFDVVYNDGVSNITLNGISNGHTVSVNPGATGNATAIYTYTLVSVSDNSNPTCSGSVSGSAIVTVHGSPVVSNIVETCNPTNTAYTVTFDIAGGDVGSYTVTGDAGTLTGSTFTSALITSGGTYTFTVNDANNCNPVVVTGNHTCACATDAGTMNTSPLAVCQNDPVTAPHNGDEAFDGDDVMMFVLHTSSGSALGTILATNNTAPTFNFTDAALTCGTTYFISAVVGNNDGTGSVDLSDPCLSVATGTPVVFNCLPTATISGTATICNGACATLTFNMTGAGPFDVVYSNGVTNITLTNISNGHTVTPCPANTTNYTLVSVTDNATGCAGSVSGNALVTVNPLPTATISGGGAICADGSVATITTDLTGTAPWTITYSDGSTATANTTPYTFTTSIAGTYTVTSISDVNCTGSSSGSAVVIVNPLPAPVVTPASAFICPGDTANLIASGSIGGNYTWSPAAGLSATTGDNIDAFPAATTTYSVIATDGNGCIDSTTVTVTVAAAIVAVVTPDTAICYGESVQLNASGGISYEWTPKNGTLSDPFIANPVATPPVTDTYSVLVSSGSCSDTVSVTITVNPLPIPSITPSDTSICIGQSSTLTASVSSGASSFSWSDGASGPANTVTPSSDQTYTVVATDVNGCVDSTTAIVRINALPVVSVTPPSAQICFGFSTSLTASGAATYSWSTLTGLSGFSADSATVNASPANTTVYSVTGTDVNGCVHDTTVIVNVVNNPVISFTGDTVICEGEFTIITAAGAESYSWFDGTNTLIGNSINVSPLVTTTYAITGTITGGCTGDTTVTIIVNSPPTPGITLSDLDAKICIGEAFTLTGTGAGTGTYTWSGTPADHGLSATSGTVVNAAPTGTGIFTYQVLVEDANGCTSTTTKTLTVNDLPVITATSNRAEICLGQQTAQLSASASTGAATFTWSPSAGLSSTTGTPVTANPSGTTIYDVTGTDANGCTNDTNITVTVNPLPVVTVTPSDTTICAGKDATLTATVTVGTAPYSYSWDTSPIKTTQSITELPAGTTDYIVTVIDDKGCISSGTGKIRVNQLPDVIASADAVCKGDTAILKAFNAATYLWQTTVDNTTTDGDSAFIYNAASSQTYQVIGTDANGCTKAAAANLIVNALPVITATASPATICIDEFSELSGSPSANMNYGYYDLGFTQLPDKNVDPKVTTSYNIIGEDNNGCKDTAMVTVNVRDSLKVTVSPDVAICFGESTTLTAVATGGDGNYFPSWVPNNGVIDGNSLTVTTVNTLDTTTTLTVTINDGCDSPSADATVTVTVNPLPVVSIDGDDGCAPWTSTFINTSSPGTYEWDFDEDGEVDDNSPTPSFTFNEADNYTVTLTVTDANGCVNSGTTIVEVYRVPEAVITSNPGKTTMINPNFEFSSEGSTGNITEWIWDFDSLGASFEPNPSFSFPDTGTYVVTLIVSTPHCSATDTITVIVTGDFTIYIPNTFTPNEDGLNDFFYPQGDGISTETGDYEMMIFNRWGEMVYQTKDYTQPWKGSRNNSGDIMQVDTYVYKIIAKDKYTGKTYQFTGHVNLIK